MVVFTTARSVYALDAERDLLIQAPGGTPCGLVPGVWHAVVYDEAPAVGETFFCSVAPPDGGRPFAVRTGIVTWAGPEPPVAALRAIGAFPEAM